MYTNFEHCDQNINTEPWFPQCPTCTMAATELNFSLSNNMSSTQYLQALQYINSIHELFSNALSKDGVKITLPQVPNFLLIFSDSKDECSHKISNIKKKSPVKTSFKHFMQRKEKTGRVRKTNSENATANTERIRQWPGVNDVTSDVMDGRSVLISQDFTGQPYTSQSTEKLKPNEKFSTKKSFARRKFMLPPAPKDRFMFRSQPGTNFFRYSSDNIHKLKNGLQYQRGFEKKSNKNKLKLSQSSPPSTKNGGIRHVQMQTSQCWNSQKKRRNNGGLDPIENVKEVKRVRSVSRKPSLKNQIRSEFFDNFMPMSMQTEKSKIFSAGSELRTESKLSSY